MLPVRERRPPRDNMDPNMDPVDNMLLQVYVMHLQLVLARVRLAIMQRNQAARLRRERRWFCRDWLGVDRRRRYGLYDQLMRELRDEDTDSFVNFMRMPPEMFDELLDRVGPRITKKTANWRQPIKPGMKLAITLCHLAAGNRTIPCVLRGVFHTTASP